MTGYSKEVEKTIPACPYHVERDIDLKQVFIAMKKGWRLYCSIAMFFILLSIALALFLPKKYLAESILLPPEESSVNSLVIPEYFKSVPVDSTQSENDTRVTGRKLYLLFLNNLQSYEYRNSFFERKNLYDMLDLQGVPDGDKLIEANKQFENNINITYKVSRVDDIKYIKVELMGKDPQLSTILLNSYIEFVDRKTINSVIDASKSKTVVEITTVQDAISSLRLIAEKTRADSIYKISEDLKIAEQLKIIEPSSFLFSTYSQKVNSITGNINTINESPGYLKGVNILQAELTTLKKRQNNDPFIPGLQKLLEREGYLKKILNMTFENVHAVRIDKTASPALCREKPSTLLIIAVGIVFGLLISFLSVLLNILYRKNTTA